MKRRSFLKTAAAMFPSAALEAILLEPAMAAPPANDVHVVPAGQDRLGISRSLGFSSIRFKVLPRETAGGLFVIEHMHLERGGPPLHYHPHQEEWFYVMDGEVLFQVGDQKAVLRSGESVLGPRGIPHAFTSVGKTPGRLLISFSPAGKMEEFFEAAGNLATPPMDPAFYRRFDVEVVGPPLAKV
jgi:mannose-6-phosphate isomerase-like protein (cupin superfamily)